MTVETTANKVIAPGNGSATVFSFSPVVLQAATDLLVVHTDSSGVETTIPSGTGAAAYSLSITTFPATGSITYPQDEVTPLPSGETITMKRVVPLTQTVDLENQGGYFADIQETAFDKATMIDLQQQDELDRCIKSVVSESGTTLDLPAAADRANKYPSFDASGNLTVSDTGATITALSSFIATLVDDATAAAARSTLGVVIGTDVQAQDAELAALAGLTSSANKIPYFTGSETAGILDFLDEDTMTSDSATAVASQQSVKAYVDASSSAWTYGSQTATTSGTTVVLTTAIPSDAQEVEIIFNGVGTDAAAGSPMIQLGTSGPTYVTTGYVDEMMRVASGTTTSGSETNAFHLERVASHSAARVVYGVMRLTRWDTSEHLWLCTYTGRMSSNAVCHSSGSITLGSALVAIQLNTDNGTANFDAGEARVRYA